MIFVVSQSLYTLALMFLLDLAVVMKSAVGSAGTSTPRPKQINIEAGIFFLISFFTNVDIFSHFIHFFLKINYYFFHSFFKVNFLIG
jgi:hypothetical protein